MLKLSNLKRKNKTVSINEINFTLKKYSLGVRSFLFMKRHEGLLEKDEKGDYTGIKGTPNFYSPELNGLEIFHGLESWELISEDGFAVEVNEKNSIDLCVYYPEEAEELLFQIREFNSINETETESEAKKK